MNRFVEDHKDTWSVKRVCEAIEIATSFYAWLTSAPGRAAHAAEDQALAATIRVLQDLLRAVIARTVPPDHERAQRWPAVRGAAESPASGSG
ncbi:MAG: hypothetical protein ACK5IN_09835 [Microbacterium sp.]|uniref:hypothetical protein n=1 Tax=Microbacterium sp. TaxID=51671 RepID=UPI003A8454E7